MKIGEIAGANTVMVGDAALNIADLKVRRELDNEGIPMMTSAWIPSADDLAVLNKGGVVALTVFGTQHPPVYVGVANG